MFLSVPYDDNLLAIVDGTVQTIIDYVVARTAPLPLLIPASSSLVISNVDTLVEEALSDMSSEFHDLQSHLDDFLRIIHQHVITSGSPSSSSDISDWNDLSRWPDITSRNEHSNFKKPLVIVDDSVEREVKTPCDSGEEKHSYLENDGAVRQLIRRPASTQLTVEVFRRAFETGNFSEVEAIMSSYSIESQFSRNVDLRVEQSVQARPRQDAVKLLPKQELSVPLPSMMLARHLNEYVPDELPSMATALQVPRRTSIDSLIVEARCEPVRPSQSASQQKQRLLELQVIKHGRHGKPKFKRLSVDTSLGVISWGTGSILMVDIKQIRCGRQTYVLNRKHAAQAYEGLFASIITPNRTLDLEMRSRTERNEIVAQIQQLIAEYLKMEKNQHVVWNRHEIDNSDVDHQVIVSNMTTYRPSRVSSWKSALLKFLFRRGSMASWTTERL